MIKYIFLCVFCLFSIVGWAQGPWGDNLPGFVRGVIPTIPDYRSYYKERGFNYEYVYDAYVGTLSLKKFEESYDAALRMYSKENKKEIKKLNKDIRRAHFDRVDSLKRENGKFILKIQPKDSIGLLLNTGEFRYGHVHDPISVDYLEEKKIKIDEDYFKEVPMLKFQIEDGEIVEIDYNQIVWLRRVRAVFVSHDSLKLCVSDYSREIIDGKSILVTEMSNDGGVRVLKTLNYVCHWWVNSSEYGRAVHVDPLLLILKEGKLLYKYGYSKPSLYNIQLDALDDDHLSEVIRNLGSENEFVELMVFWLRDKDKSAGKNKKLVTSDYSKFIYNYVLRDLFLNRVLLTEKI